MTSKTLNLWSLYFMALYCAVFKKPRRVSHSKRSMFPIVREFLFPLYVEEGKEAF